MKIRNYLGVVVLGLATGCGGGGTSQSSGSPSSSNAPSMALNANATSVISGGSATLAWSSSNVTACTASGAWSGAKLTSGSEQQNNLTQSGTYTLTCTGSGGMASRSVTINVSGGQPNVITGGRGAVDLSVDGRIFEVDLTQNYYPWLTPGNGGVINYLASGGYDGMPGVEIRAPTIYPDPEPVNVQYTSILGGPSASGNNAVYQINFGYFVFFGPNWSTANHTHGPKYLIVLGKDAVAATPSGVNRPMVFIGGGGAVPASYASVGITEATTIAYYQYPVQPGNFWPAGPGQDALYIGPAPDHAGANTNGTPVIGNEWVWMEHRIDFSSHRGNPSGRHSLGVWTSDGVLAGTVLDISLAQNGTYNAAHNMFGTIEGLGHYWNYDATRMDNDGAIFSRPRLVANLGTNEWMGPPPGFLP